MNMTSLDLLYLALAAGFITLVVFVNMILFNVWKIVRSFRVSIERVEHLSDSVIVAKNKVKSFLLSALKDVIGKYKKHL